MILWIQWKLGEKNLQLIILQLLSNFHFHLENSLSVFVSNIYSESAFFGHNRLKILRVSIITHQQKNVNIVKCLQAVLRSFMFILDSHYYIMDWIQSQIQKTQIKSARDNLGIYKDSLKIENEDSSKQRVWCGSSNGRPAERKSKDGELESLSYVSQEPPSNIISTTLAPRHFVALTHRRARRLEMIAPLHKNKRLIMYFAHGCFLLILRSTIIWGLWEWQFNERLSTIAFCLHSPGSAVKLLIPWFDQSFSLYDANSSAESDKNNDHLVQRCSNTWT